MKYSFMTFSCPGLDLAGVLGLAAKVGYDGVELRIDAGHGHGVEVDTDKDQRREIREQANRAGVAIACIATSCKFADAEAGEQTLADAKERIYLAADVGAPVVRVFGGPFGDDLTREEAIEGMARRLGAVADDAEELGVTVCLETHDVWSDPRHVAAVLEKVDRRSVGANWDVIHPVRRGLATVEESFEVLRPWIRHLHIHDGIQADDGGMVLRPIGKGIVDHRLVLECLESIRFRGFLSGEWIRWSDTYDVHLPAELATLKRYEAERSKKR